MTAENTMYQQAVEKFGKEEADRLSNRTVDPETGYVGRSLGRDYGSEIRCVKCGGRAMWHATGKFNKETALCLKCSDEWGMVSHRLLRKYGYVSSHKKWMQAFNDFIKMKPKDIDIEKHNAEIKAGDDTIHSLFPSYFSK